MGRFDVGIIRFLEKDHFRVLISVEMGMKNHELVPLQLVASIAGIHRGAVARNLSDLQKHRLVLFERDKRADGYRLTSIGYDFLALKALCLRGVVGSVGNQIGVGKESDVYVGGDPDLNDLILKFHRLGRTSFRKLKEKRDYHRGRKACSWLYLARLAASKEFAFLKALYEHKFPVPRPINLSRHVVVMEFINGVTLCHVHSVKNVGDLYDQLMSIIVRLGRYGLIHGDFNEFNIVLNGDNNPVLIDFPQMLSMDHPNAEFYFNRDVECVRSFFRKRFEFESELYPKFGDVKRRHNIDVEVAASGFTKNMASDLNAVYDSGNFAEIEAILSLSSDESDADEVKNETEDEFYREQMKGQKIQTRLDSWLEEVHNQFEGLNPFSDKVYSHALPSEEQISKSKEVVITEGSSDFQSKAVCECDDTLLEHQKEEEDSIKKRRNSIHVPNSTYSTGSTISREEICKRIALEQRAKRKMKLRLKGKASTVRCGRKSNMSIIKEYVGWEF